MNPTDEIERRLSEALCHVADLPVGTVETWGSPAARSSPARAAIRRPRGGRMAVAVGVVAVITVAAVAVVTGTSHHTKVVVGTNPIRQSVGTPITIPTVPGTTGWSPADYGQVRVYLPPGWISVGECTGDQASSAVSDTYLLVPRSASQGFSCAVPSNGGWASIGPLSGTPPASWTRSTINGMEEWEAPDQGSDIDTIDLPAEGVQLVAVGDGRTILATVTYSSLHALLELSHPVEVPASWKAVRIDGLQAEVPPSWPVQTLTPKVMEPGSCSPQIFDSPQVDFGNRGFIPLCGLKLGQLPRPEDGLWIQPGPNGPTGDPTQTFTSRSVTAQISYSDTDVTGAVTTQADITTGAYTVTIGLGPDPTIAEEILSSLQPTGLANTASTPTTISPTETTITPPAHNQPQTTS